MFKELLSALEPTGHTIGTYGGRVKVDNVKISPVNSESAPVGLDCGTPDFGKMLFQIVPVEVEDWERR